MAKVGIKLALALWVALSVSFAFAANPKDEPIRVGFLTIKSGALAAGGKQMEDGIQLFLKERNNTLNGRKVELFIADTSGQPAITKTKAQELVEKNKVQVIIGPLAAFEALALDDYIRKMEIPTIAPSAAAEDLTQRKANPWFVRAVGSSAQSSHALGDYAAKDLKLKRVAIIGDDFAYGHETVAGFQRTFEENGGKVVQKLWSPLNVTDYGPYIVQLKPNVDAVYVAFAGGNGAKFLKQYNEYGMINKLPLLGSMTAFDEGILPSMGPEAVGIISSGWYAAGIKNPENAKLVQSMNAAYKMDPGYYSMGAYNAGLMLEQALKDTNGNIDNKQQFMSALKTVQINNDPLGKFKLDALGNPIMDVYIRKVQMVNGKLSNAVIKTYPNVSQFWTYKTGDFLANPVYSRDYPPANNIEK